MKKLTIGILTISILLIGCLQDNKDKKKPNLNSKKIAIDTVKIIKKPKKFKITQESMIGNWFVVSSNRNPKFFNKILVGADYITFYPNGIIKEKTFYPDRIDEKVGKYVIDTSTNVVTIKYNEIQHKWRQVSSGKALEFYWINTELDFKKNLNSFHIKRGSKEWNKYGKKRIDMDKVRDIVNSVDALELKKGFRYKISKQTPLMTSNTPTGSINPFYLKSGTIIEILSKNVVEGTIWYHTKIPSANKKGWISSIALFGQNIRKVSN